jgi:hypothetical protein
LPREAQGQGREVELGKAAVAQGYVDFHEELEAGQGAALQKPGLGQEGGGCRDPRVALRLGEGAPALGDGGEEVADGLLGRCSWVKGDEGGVADLAVAVALPDEVAAFAGFGVGRFHDWLTQWGYLPEGREFVKAGVGLSRGTVEGHLHSARRLVKPWRA